MDVAKRPAALGSRVSGVPRPPSWIDRLTAGISSLPLPPWLTYAFGIVGAALILNSAFWIDGSLSVGSFHPLLSSYGGWIIYWLAMYHYLSTVGSRALREFRPLLEIDDSEFSQLEHRLASLPRWIGWLVVPLGAGLAFLIAASDPQPYWDLRPLTPIPLVVDGLVSSFMLATFLALVLRSIRQLRMVAELHKRALNIDLLNLVPAHAFSELTARTGATLIFVVLVGTLINMLSTGAAVGTSVHLLLTAGVSVLAVVVFVLPVAGMQNRLEEEKERVLGGINDSLRIASNRLHSKVKSNEYDDMAGREAAMAALMRERDLIQSVSTWPWDPRTLRGFGSALVLPIFLWTVTRLLEQYF